jgi:hypothetical protein
MKKPSETKTLQHRQTGSGSLNVEMEDFGANEARLPVRDVV